MALSLVSDLKQIRSDHPEGGEEPGGSSSMDAMHNENQVLDLLFHPSFVIHPSLSSIHGIWIYSSECRLRRSEFYLP